MEEVTQTISPEKENSLIPGEFRSLGLRLKEVRESRGLTPDDVSAATCIRQNFIEDIESGDFSRFKALVYARGFVRSYVTYLEVPEIWEEYDNALVTEPFEAIKNAARPEKESLRPSVYTAGAVHVPTSAAAAPTRGFKHSAMRRNFIYLLCVLLILGLGAIVLNWNRIHGEAGKIRREQAYTEQKSIEEENNRREAERKAELEKVEKELASAGGEKEVSPETVKEEKTAEEVLPEPAPKPELVVRATGACWMRVMRGNRKILETTLKKGDERRFDLSSRLTVRYGAGHHVTVSVNGGKSARPGRGVCRIAYSPDGKVVQLRKK